ncbi:MAG: hypothetical protein ABR569_08105 [Gaiellaceae bacterium]
MSLTLSPQMKIVALVGMLAALALGGGTMYMSRAQPSFSTTIPSVPLKHFKPTRGTPAAQASAKHAAARPATAHPRKSVATKAAPAALAPKPRLVAPKPKPRPAAASPAVAANGLPTALNELLHEHRVVAVSIYDSEVPTDAWALREVRAGARDAGAGFLAVNVLDGRITGPLTKLAGNGTLLPAPGILIYRQPGSLMNRIDGFADRESVSSAIANALVATEPVAAATTSTATPVP